ncbi:MAG: hypothetical protein ACREQI_09315 [Candidatus Binataceae bacterium]
MNRRFYLRSALAGAAILFACVLAAGTVAARRHAARGPSTSELDAQLTSIEGQLGEAQSNPAVASDVINKLDSAESTFAQIASQPGADKTQLAPTYDRLESMLSRMYQAWDKKRQDCINQISNGGAQCDYSTPEQYSLRALYPLSWLRYTGGAVIYSDSPERARQLLNKAIDGFTQSILVIPNADLTREDMLGRAYCYSELGKFDKSNYDKAIEDFTEIYKAGPSTRQYKAAQQGLATTYMKMGEPDKAQKYVSGSANTGGGQLFQLQAMFDAENAAGSSAKKAQQHGKIVAVLKEHENTKDGFAIDVDAVNKYSKDPIAEFGSSSDPFEKWLLANVLLVRKDEARAAKYFAEAAASGKYPQGYRYAASIYLKQGRYDQAESLLASMVHGGGGDAQWAAYRQYQIPRTRWEQSGMKDAALDDAWVKAATAYLQKYPQGEHSPETRFRLAERLQQQKKYVEAADMYAQIKGKNDYSFTAKFNGAECNYLALANAGGKNHQGPKIDIEKRKADAIAGLEDTINLEPEVETATSSAAGRKFVHDTRGRAIYMLAGLLEAEPKIDYAKVASILQGFERQYPEMSSTFHDVIGWYLTALDRLGKYDEAQTEVAAIVQRNKGNIENNDFIKGLGIEFWNTARKAQAAGNQKAYLANAKLTSTAYSYFTEMVAENKIPVKNLTGTLSIMGQCLQAQGEEAKAEQIYQEVVKADPASPDANAGLARIAQAKHSLAKALSLWTNVEATAAESDPLWYEAKFQMAVIYSEQGNRKAACSKLLQTRIEHPSLGSPAMKAQWNALQTKICLNH